ncbi:MAG: hypothetical protein H7Y88_11310 [Phycisphaerales bacterium]|nr:hypothetical protein [Phycisphaerales bacterium]
MIEQDEPPLRARESPLVLLVGHCAPDSTMLRSAVQRAIPGARIERINDARSLESAHGGAALLLINRVLDGDFTESSGIDMIERLVAQSQGGPPALVLVSDRPDAQHRVQAVGALPGFGKAGLHSGETLRRIESACARWPIAKSRPQPRPA